MVSNIKQSPLVSITCLTYNHAPYLRQCLDGFVMQKTSFPIEILIYDDASEDGTQDIIREYERKYPDLIKPIYQTENQYSKGVKVEFVYNYPRAKGKYIAFCEGDDYWTDPNKLQKQIDFLERHQEHVMCSHQYKLYFQKEKINDLMYFIPIRSVRKISYAVSMEYKSLDDISDHPEFYLSTLSSYAAISVREKAIADRLGTIGIKKVKMTCDPTLLLTKKDYLQLIKRGTRLSYGKYILVYHLAYSDELNKLAGYISQQTGFEVINVHTQLRTRRKKMEIQDFGPIDLLSLINNAEYVLTTSFHAVAFSLILEKQFYAIKTAFSNRIENILRCMNIENRLLEDTFPDMAQRIDYTQVESCRSRFINESIDFIKSNVI